MTEPESVRWVRYAADCAERVLPLTGNARPQAEAAIVAARAWADHPCEEQRQAAKTAALSARAAVRSANATAQAIYAAVWVARAAGSTGAAETTAQAAYAADRSAGAAYIIARAADASWDIAYAAHDPVAERAWQAERRKHYGLPEEGA